MATIKALAAKAKRGRLEPFEYDPGPLGPDQVDITVQSCGICHSDLSMLNDDWHMSAYPLVPGHEVVGTVAAVGNRVTAVEVGQSRRGFR